LLYKLNASSEVNVLNSILRFTPSPTVPDAAYYRAKYLKEGLGEQNASASPFQVFTNGPAYKWKSWHIGKRNRAGTDVDWANAGVTAVNPESLFDWLDIQGSKNIAFTVDATCVPFFRVFKDGLAFSGTRTAYNILTREGVSDSAGKGIGRTTGWKAHNDAQIFQASLRKVGQMGQAQHAGGSALHPLATGGHG
jgi:hypothetical protein